ncbi:MAG: GcrA family cell cycle regulator [Parcubacteria group bacterium]
MTFWTVERIALCHALWAEKHSFGEIARQIGATRDMVSSKVRRMGLSRSAKPQVCWTARELTILRTARAEGATFEKIAEMLPRRTAAQCRAMASYRKIRRPGPPPTPKERGLTGDALYVAECLARGGFPTLRLAA